MTQLTYTLKNGCSYPNLQISNDKADYEQPVGKYGMMWLKFMHEWHYDRYIELRMDGNLLEMAHNINNETHDMIKEQSNHVTLSIDWLITESNVTRDFVLKIR